MKRIDTPGKRWGFLALALFLAALALAHGVRRPPDADKAGGGGGVPLDVALAARVFPEAVSTRLARDGGWTVVVDGDAQPLGAVASSSPEMDGILGYAGPVPVLIGVNPAGLVQRIVLLDNQETPGFVRRVERAGFLGKWSGLSVSQAAALEVDAVSMATLTSSAIAQSIRGRLARLDGLPMEEMEARPASGFFALTFGPLDAAILVLMAGAIGLFLRVGVLKNPRVFRVVRVGLLLASVVLLGWVGASMISMALIEGWAVAGRIHGGAGLALLVLAAVAFPLLASRNLYCQTLCPFGALQELLWTLSPRKRHLPHPVSHRLRRVRYLLLLAVVLSMIAGRGLAPDLQEPFSAFRWQAAGWAARGIAALALAFTLLGFHRPWCSYFCSSGALLDAIRKTPKPEKEIP